MKHIPPKAPTSGHASPIERSEPPKPVVLYVEDDAVNQRVARTRLSKKYTLRSALNDREACQRVVEGGSVITLVLMDIELQGSNMNGIELTRLLRGKPPASQRPPYAANVPAVDVPILFVTAYGQRFSEAELFEAGGDNVIGKPIDFVQLQTAMARTYLNRQRR